MCNNFEVVNELSVRIPEHLYFIQGVCQILFKVPLDHENSFDLLNALWCELSLLDLMRLEDSQTIRIKVFLLMNLIVFKSRKVFLTEFHLLVIPFLGQLPKLNCFFKALDTIQSLFLQPLYFLLQLFYCRYSLLSELRYLIFEFINSFGEFLSSHKLLTFVSPVVKVIRIKSKMILDKIFVHCSS